MSATSVKSKRLEWNDSPVVEYELFQAYPNPFNLNTTIGYKLSNPAFVQLHIYNTTGQLIKTLVDGARAEGRHTVRWDGTDDLNQVMPSGVYFYTLRVDDDKRTTELSRKIMLVK